MHNKEISRRWFFEQCGVGMGALAFNQLMAAENVEPRSGLTGAKREKRIAWWLAFIEDALDTHLADKPAYANVIGVLLAEPEISEEDITKRIDTLR